MKVKVNFTYNMEYLLKTWSELCLSGSGLWYVNVEELSEEWEEWKEDNSDLTFEDFIDEYFHSFKGLDLDSAINLTIDEEDLICLENVCINNANRNY